MHEHEATERPGPNTERTSRGICTSLTTIMDIHSLYAPVVMYSCGGCYIAHRMTPQRDAMRGTLPGMSRHLKKYNPPHLFTGIELRPQENSSAPVESPGMGEATASLHQSKVSCLLQVPRHARHQVCCSRVQLQSWSLSTQQQLVEF
jgi:hypothetical protein